MTDSITLPPELVQRLLTQFHTGDIEGTWVTAAQWGADQELEACCHEVQDMYSGGSRLRTARRPKPPSLKEQALKAVNEMSDCMSAGFVPKRSDLDAIRRALEALPE